MKRGWTIAFAVGALLTATPGAAQTQDDAVTSARERRDAAQREYELQQRLAQEKRIADKAAAKVAKTQADIAAIAPAATATPPAETPQAQPPQAKPPRVQPPQAPPVANVAPSLQTDAAEQALLEQKKDEADEKFGKLPLGAGLSLTIDLGKKDRIGSAEIINGTVRVIDQNNTPARLTLETHYFFKPNRAGPFGLREKMWGFGPFIAVQPSDDRIIEAIGLGLMIGFRREETKTDSFNLGVGLMIDPDTRVLGDGFAINAPPPPGETEVRYRETTQKGIVLMTSFSF